MSTETDTAGRGAAGRDAAGRDAAGRDAAGRTRRLRGPVVTGVVATLAAVAATTVAAALAHAAGVDFEIPDGGGESIPTAGFAVVTGVFSLVGVVIAVALRRWSAHPARRFAWTAVVLTAISLVAPFLSGAAPATVAALVGLHLIPAAVMIPALTRSLRGPGDGVHSDALPAGNAPLA